MDENRNAADHPRTHRAPRLTGMGGLTLTLCALYVGLRFWNLATVHTERVFPDSAAFQDVASKPLLSWDFWGGQRPPTVPLFYKLLGNDPFLVTRFQWTLSAVSWVLLAIIVSREVITVWLRPVALGVILLFSLSPEVLLWDCVVLGESISLSLMVLLIGSGLWVARERTPLRVTVFLLLSLLWALARESNAWMLVPVAGAITVAGVLWRVQWRYLAVAGLLTAFFVLSELSSSAGQRWAFPLLNNLGLRVLEKEDQLAFFERAGMPVSPALRKRAGKPASGDDWAFYRDPELEEFRRWFYEQGKWTYVEFLLSRPLATLREPLRRMHYLVSPALNHYGPEGWDPVLPGRVARAVYFRTWPFLWFTLAAGLVAYAITQTIRTRQTRWVVPAGLILLALPHAILVWNADPMETGRHSLPWVIHYRIGLWMLILLGSDQVAQMRGLDDRFRKHLERKPGPDAPQSLTPGSPSSSVPTR